MTNQTLKLMLILAAFAVLACPASTQTVRIEFTTEVTQVGGNLIPSVTVGSILTGVAEVDLNLLPEDYDPSPSIGGHNYSAGPAGYTLEFTAGGQTIRYDSVNAATDGGTTPGIFLTDEAGAHDWVTIQARDQGNPYAAVLSFEQYGEI